MKPLLPALAALTLVLPACRVGPNYLGPANTPVNAGDYWAGPEANSADPGDLMEWWKNLRDPRLNSLMVRALENNKDLRIAFSRVAEARAQRAIARSGLFPQIEAGGSATRSGSSENGSSTPGARGSTPPVNLFNLNLDASWEIDVFGGTRREIEAATADLEAAREAARDARVGLISEVAIAYVELRGYQARKSVAERNLKAQRETLELTRSRLAAGVASDLDVARAETQAESTAATVPVFEAAIRRAIYRLGVLLGGTPDSLVNELLAQADIPPSTTTVPLGLPSDLLRRRPDVRRAERELAAATARLGVAVADLYPRFNLTAGTGLRSLEADTLFRGRSNFWSLGPSLNWPVFTAGRIRGNIAAQNARQEQAALAYERTVLTALEDVEASLISFGQEQKRYASLTRAVESSRRAARLANERYKAGVTGFLEVLDAERELLMAEDAQVESRTQMTLNLVRLYKALGGGWGEERYKPENKQNVAAAAPEAKEAKPETKKSGAKKKS